MKKRSTKSKAAATPPRAPSPRLAALFGSSAQHVNQSVPFTLRPARIQIPTAEWEQMKAENILLRAQVQELEDQKRILEELNERDPLTGVGNRRGLERAYGTEQAHIRRLMIRNERGQLDTKCDIKGSGIIFLDGDEFGKVNKIHGDQTGDRVIQAIALSLERQTRKTDIVTRKGGDEFVILVPNIRPDDLEKLLYGPGGLQERLNTNTSITTPEGKELVIQCSMGFAHFGVDDELNDVLSRADASMRANKQSRKKAKQQATTESEQKTLVTLP